MNSQTKSKTELKTENEVMRGCITQYVILVGELSKGLDLNDPIWDDIRDCGKTYFDLFVLPEISHTETNP